MTRLVFVAVALLLGCNQLEAQLQRDAPVVFGERSTRDDAGRTIRVFIDRNGHMYPRGQHGIRDHHLRRIGELRRYFAVEFPGEWTILRNRYGVGPRPSFEHEWLEVQDSLTSRLARLLSARTQSGAPLVVLIHGFNVSSTDTPYPVVRDRIEKELSSESAVFLEVYWDGHFSPSKRDAGAVWSIARGNAPLVGGRLGMLLSDVKPNAQIRVLTHSLGASVAASALWRRRDVQAERHRTPMHHDLRVGMIVPAIDGKALPAVPPLNSNFRRRIVVGQNRWDYAVSKTILPSSALGSTRLGVSRDEYCKFAWPVFNRRPNWSEYRVQLSTEVVLLLWQEHALSSYAAHPSSNSFFRLLFAEEDFQSNHC